MVELGPSLCIPELKKRKALRSWVRGVPFQSSFHTTVESVLSSRNLLPDEGARPAHEDDVDHDSNNIGHSYSSGDFEILEKHGEEDEHDDEDHEGYDPGGHIQRPGIHAELSTFLPHMPAHSHPPPFAFTHLVLDPYTRGKERKDRGGPSFAFSPPGAMIRIHEGGGADLWADVKRKPM
jgi:hypothetical protein